MIYFRLLCAVNLLMLSACGGSNTKTCADFNDAAFAAADMAQKKSICEGAKSENGSLKCKIQVLTERCVDEAWEQKLAPNDCQFVKDPDECKNGIPTVTSATLEIADGMCRKGKDVCEIAPAYRGACKSVTKESTTDFAVLELCSQYAEANYGGTKKLTILPKGHKCTDIETVGHKGMQANPCQRSDTDEQCTLRKNAATYGYTDNFCSTLSEKVASKDNDKLVDGASSACGKTELTSVEGTEAGKSYPSKKGGSSSICTAEE